MGLSKRYHRPSAAVQKDKRWKWLRLQAKRRDGFKCVQCGASGDLEVDHVKPVRTHPELSFELTNLQTLCVRCHARKTRIEVGLDEIDPQRREWKDCVFELAKPKKEPRNA
ncbi:HNH endonuclease [Sinorhizobium fredii]|uniref:HNH endonuclease n=1 Tax=Rhizobium fredii TaxID=380 RepID=UPI0004AE3465|nr:HNH endonuclease signature motif containing protein [Sinorhizobium fredii]